MARPLDRAMPRAAGETAAGETAAGETATGETATGETQEHLSLAQPLAPFHEDPAPPADSLIMPQTLLETPEASETPHAASAQGLANSISRNTLFGMIANLAQVVTRVVTVPVVIHHLGVDGYGIWNVIMTTGSYMRFGSAGLKTAFQKYVGEATGSGDYKLANQLLSTGCAVMALLSLAGLIPVVLFSTQVAAWAGVPPKFMHSASGAFALLALIYAMSNVGAAFEAVVMGGHRIDLVRKFTTVLTVLEAVAIVIFIQLGKGLLAMALVMGTSELIYIVSCYFAARRVVPQIHLQRQYLTKDVLPELVRFAGSYQLVNLMEVAYNSLLPFAILKAFGAEVEGIYAIVGRVVGSAALLQQAFLPAILSGGSMVYASGSVERMRALLVKACKAATALSIFPLGFAAAFGPMLVLAWTGTASAAFGRTFWLLALTAFFQGLSLLGLVLYRISGRALLDNVRQAGRIVMGLVIAAYARQLGFYWVLAGIAFTEMAGMLFMLFALTRTFEGFSAKSLLPDLNKVVLAALAILLVGVAVSYLPVPGIFEGRRQAMFKLGGILIACAAVAWPVLLRTGTLSAAEGSMIVNTIRNRTRVHKRNVL